MFSNSGENDPKVDYSLLHGEQSEGRFFERASAMRQKCPSPRILGLQCTPLNENLEHKISPELKDYRLNNNNKNTSIKILHRKNEGSPSSLQYVANKCSTYYKNSFELHQDHSFSDI